MAINPETQYPGKIAPSTPDYPYGAARNVTIPGDGTGTPWEAALVNDILGWQQALLDDAGVVPSGTPEKVGASQYIVSMIKKKLTPAPTTAAMKALKNVTLGMAVLTSGFVGANDGGAAFYDTALTSGVTVNELDTFVSDVDPTISYVLRPQSGLQLAALGIVGDGSTVENTAIVNAIEYAGANGVRKLIGDPLKTYLFEDSIGIIERAFLEIDFAGATLKDNVQTTFPASRGAPLITIFNSRYISVHSFNYEVEGTRSNLANPTIPTTVIWIGGQTLQTLDSEVTEYVTVSDISFGTPLVGMTAVGCLGEMKGCNVKNIDCQGDWSYGLNSEFGKAPEDPAINPTYQNGRHPYGLQVENLNGFNAPNCSGFLRVAGVYNTKFINCVGSNVANFIFVFGGDKNISRFSENVTFENCNHHYDSSGPALGINNVATVLFPSEFGGGPLPSWTNYNHNVIFNGCEWQNNDDANSSALRHISNLGKTVLNNCILRNGYWGIRTGISASALNIGNRTLTVNNTQFINNEQDVRVLTENGVEFNGCKFLESRGTLPPISIEGANNTKFNHCFMDGLQLAQNWVSIDDSSVGTDFDHNEFTINTLPAIKSLSRCTGRNNTPKDGTLADTSNTGLYCVQGQPATYTRDIMDFYVTGAHDGANDASVLTDSGASWEVDQFVGLVITNTTDGSRGTITANTANTITATLSGGAENDWDTGDAYALVAIDADKSPNYFAGVGASAVIENIIGGEENDEVSIASTSNGASVTFNTDTGAGDIRFITKDNANVTLNSQRWSITFRKQNGAWFELNRNTVPAS